MRKCPLEGGGSGIPALAKTSGGMPMSAANSSHVRRASPSSGNASVRVLSGRIAIPGVSPVVASTPDGRANDSTRLAALEDPYSGNLDRIQIIRGWLDEKGETHEKVYDVVSGDADSRQPDAHGKLPPVGNTVDVESATWMNTIGDPELITVWKDPDFDASQPAFYYARVIEIPTLRWTAYDAQRSISRWIPRCR